MQTIIIVAMTPEGLIGKGGKLPWHIPADLKHFKQTTEGHAVLMGRKTFDSIAKPLPRRRNIIITRDPSKIVAMHEADSSSLRPQASSHSLSTSLDAVGSLQAGLDLCRTRNEKKAFIAGGAQIYQHALGLADELLVTWVRQPVRDGDTFFPPWNPSDWTAVPISSNDEIQVVSYRRRFA